MSDKKRVNLTTIANSDGKKTSTNILAAAAAASQSSRTSASAKTFRINLNLFEPTSEAFPEFNYVTLLQIEKEKHRKLSKSKNGCSDPFEENNDDVVRIAKEFERKYGNAYMGKSAGRIARRINNDYYDKGAGYDENDDFIDNTEAYDEVIPDEMEADRGGFYINSGPLVFQKLANFERPEDAQRMPKPRKRALSTTSESSDTDKEEDKNYKGATPKSNSNKSKSSESETVKVNKKVKFDSKIKDDGAGSDSSKENVNKKVLKTTTVKDMLRAKRDSMRNMVETQSRAESTANDSDRDSSSSDDSTDTSSDDDDDEDDEDGDENDDDDVDGDDKKNIENNVKSKAEGLSDKNKKKIPPSNSTTSQPQAIAPNPLSIQPQESVKDSNDPLKIGLPKIPPSTASQIAATPAVKLPNNINEELLKNINKLVTAAQLPSANKNNFFDSTNTDLLYKIDTSARKEGAAIRNVVYSYLEMCLPYTKQTILSRAKKSRIQNVENKAKKLIQKLRTSVDAVMPNVLKTYELECKRIQEMRAQVVVNMGTTNSEKPEQFKNPRRRFPWNDNSRKFLVDVINCRRESFDIVKPKKDTLDEFIKIYLKENVLKLWPSGWMKLEIILSEAEKYKKKNQQSIAKANSNATTLLAQNINNNNLLKNTTKISSTQHVVPGHDKKPTANHINSDATNFPLKLSSANSSYISSSVGSALYSSSLTITAVSSNEVPLKITPSIQNKIIITNVESLSSTASATSKSSQPSQKLSTTPITNSTNKLSASPIMDNITANAITADTYISPTKKATDHSINSIISSSHVIDSQKIESVNPTTTSYKSDKTIDTPSTHVIDLDNLKTNADILNKVAAASNSNTIDKHSLKIKSSNETNDTNLEFDDLPKALNSTDKNSPGIMNDVNQILPDGASTKSGKTISTRPSFLSDDDDVEFVDEVLTCTQSNIVKTGSKPSTGIGKLSKEDKKKYSNKTQNSQYKASRSNSPVKNNNIKVSESTSECDTKKKTKCLSNTDPLKIVKDSFPSKCNEGKEKLDILLSGLDSIDPELDVNQVMRALKELQEMQSENVINVSSSSDDSIASVPLSPLYH